MNRPTPGHWPSLRPTLVDHGRLLQAIVAESELLVRTAALSQPDLPVPGCPGLTLGEAVRHTGSVYRRVLAWMRAGEEPDDWQREPEAGQTPLDFHAGASAALVAELAAHDPDQPCDTWSADDRSYGFWRRRMAHETAVHRADVQAAAGAGVTPVAVDFAADGVDEVLRLWFGQRLAMRNMAATHDGAVGVQVAGCSWLALLDRHRCSARRTPAVDAMAADALVTGEPTDVYLWLWGRAPDQLVTISGDIDAAAQLWALLRTTTQ